MRKGGVVNNKKVNRQVAQNVTCFFVQNYYLTKCGGCAIIKWDSIDSYISDVCRSSMVETSRVELSSRTYVRVLN